VDYWKQLVEGNGRGNNPSNLPPRIPAIVYVSRNCVDFRQKTARLLAEEFRDLATNGTSGVENTESGNRRRRLGGALPKSGAETGHREKEEEEDGASETNKNDDFEALLQRAAEFNRDQKQQQQQQQQQKNSGSASNTNEPKSVLEQAYHDDMVPNVQIMVETGGRDDWWDDDHHNNNYNDNDDDDDDYFVDDNGRPPSSFVHYGGECRVRGGIPVPSGVLEGWENRDRSKFRNNYETIYTRYKYCLVMENTQTDGYVTEKLMHALLGGCLPIYYGSKNDAYKIFRNDAFVYLDIHDPGPALEEIRRLEANPHEYFRRTDPSLPLLRSTLDPSTGKPSTEETLDAYFSLLPDIGTGKLCKELHEMMGLPLPESLRAAADDGAA
jgi:hypothetical protein